MFCLYAGKMACQKSYFVDYQVIDSGWVIWLGKIWVNIYPSVGKIWVNLPTFTPVLTLNTLVMFTLFSRFRRKTSLRQLLTEFNRSLMLIADRQLLVDNFLAKVRQLLAVERASLVPARREYRKIPTLHRLC